MKNAKKAVVGAVAAGVTAAVGAATVALTNGEVKTLGALAAVVVGAFASGFAVYYAKNEVA